MAGGGTFILFAIIVLMTLAQRWLLRERDGTPGRSWWRPRLRRAGGARRRRRSPTGRLLASRAGGYAVLAFFSVVFLYPFVIQLSNAFKSEPDAAAHPLSPIPRPFDDSSFVHIFAATHFPLWLLNSVLVTVVATLGRIFFDSLAGYALARMRFTGRRAMFAIVLAMMSVPPVVLLIPKFLVVNQLGIYDSYVGLILPLIADAACSS